MSGEDVRQRLAEALRGQRVVIDSRPVDQRGGPFGGGWCGPLDNTDELADALLPVVADLIAQARADEREKAYWTVIEAGDVWLSRDKRAAASVVVDYLADLAHDVKFGRAFRPPVAWAAAAAGPTHEGDTQA